MVRYICKDPFYSGDSSMVQEKLVDVCHVKASGRAFAAILGDGSVVTWDGKRLRDRGGDSSDVQDLLKEVKFIAATDQAFAALRLDALLYSPGQRLQNKNQHHLVLLLLF